MSDSRTVRVAMLKMESRWGDTEHNIAAFERIVGPLGELRPDLIITPECFLDGYMERDKERCTKQAVAACAVRGGDDPLIGKAARIAATLRSYIVFGATERSDNGSLRNAAYLIDRDGGHAGTYYKVQTAKIYDPGDDLPVFSTDFGRLGIVICADRRWPENIRCLRLKGAELIANPTWGARGELNTAIMRTRACENGLSICFTHPHESLVCAADGSIAAMLHSNVPGVLVHDIDLSQNISRVPDPDREVAACWPIQHRRPELYRVLVEAEE